MMARRGRQQVRWVVYAALICAAGILVIADQRLKHSEAAGYIPDNATWRVWSADLPAFWSSLQSHELWERTRPELLPLARRIELRLTRAAGVRPTPGRVRLWLGDRVLAGAVGDDAGISVRPGVLMRAALFAARLGATREDNGVYRFRDVSWAWRDGFLILSTSPAYVGAALDAAEPVRMPADKEPAIGVALRDERDPQPYFEARLGAGPGLPIEGRLRVDGAGAPMGPVLRAESPVPAMVFVSCGRVGGLRSIVDAVAERLPEVQSFEAVEPYAREFIEYFRGMNALGAFSWESVEDRAVSVVFPAILPDVVPLPVIGVELERARDETQHPLSPLLALTSPIEHEWSGSRGVLAPVWGEAVTLCLAPRGDGWVAATTEPIMAQLMAVDHAAVEEGHEQAVVEVSWAELAAPLPGLSETWQEFAVAQGLSERKYRDRVQRLRDVLRKVGSTRLVGTFEGGALQFHGGLAEPADAA